MTPEQMKAVVDAIGFGCVFIGVFLVVVGVRLVLAIR